MSDSKEWILNALRDIEQVCLETGLERTGAMLKQTLEIAVDECCSDPKAKLTDAENTSDFLH